jgi:hypothetical protein
MPPYQVTMFSCRNISCTWMKTDRLCDLVPRIPGYRFRDPGFDSWRNQILWEILGLERGPLSLVRIIKEVLEWKISGSVPKKIEINGRGDPLCWPRGSLYPQKLALTLPKCSTVRLRTKTTEFSFSLVISRDVSITCLPRKEFSPLMQILSYRHKDLCMSVGYLDVFEKFIRICMSLCGDVLHGIQFWFLG